VLELIDQVGFTGVDAGTLADSRRLRGRVMLAG
jgi:predicted dinucleotide-binding enzyme